MDISPNFNSDGTQARSTPIDAKAPFLICLFHTPNSIGTKPQPERESLHWQSFLQGLEDNLCIPGKCANNKHIEAHF